MFVTASQFYVFVACVGFGGACGILFTISAIIKTKINNLILRIIPDLVAFLITAMLYCFYAFILCFPNFRIYMTVGVLLGILIYFKSFHILLANLLKKLYNIKDKLFTRIKKTKDERE